MRRPLRVLLEASCLADGRKDAGIGRYARQLVEALEGVGGLRVTRSVPASPAWSESRPARFLRAQPQVIGDAMAQHPHLVHGIGGGAGVAFPMFLRVGHRHAL